MAQTRNATDRYNAKTLIPFMVGFAAVAALVDTYQSIDSNVDGKSVAQAIDWTWTQNSDFPDECMDAAAASPAPLDELLAIGGGAPPAHPNCNCELSAGPASDVLLSPQEQYA
jgi:hypothetical protein